MTVNLRHFAAAAGAAFVLALGLAAPSSASAAGGACVVDSGAHGQGMLATAQAAAQGAAVSYVDAGEPTTFDALAAGVLACVDDGASVIGVSWAAAEFTPGWANAVQEASSRGALVLLAAGNSQRMAAKCGSTCATALVAGGVSVSTAGELAGQVEVSYDQATSAGWGGSSAATAYAAGVAAHTGALSADALRVALAAEQAGVTENADVEDPVVESAAVQKNVKRQSVRFSARRVGRRVVVSVGGLRAGQRLLVQVGRDRYEGNPARVTVSRARLPRRIQAKVLSDTGLVTSVHLTVRR